MHVQNNRAVTRDKGKEQVQAYKVDATGFLLL